MAATAGRSLPLLLCRRPAALTAAGCFPALGRRRQQQRHRTVSVAGAVPFRRRPAEAGAVPAQAAGEARGGAPAPPRSPGGGGPRPGPGQLCVILSAVTGRNLSGAERRQPSPRPRSASGLLPGPPSRRRSAPGTSGCPRVPPARSSALRRARERPRAARGTGAGLPGRGSGPGGARPPGGAWGRREPAGGSGEAAAPGVWGRGSEGQHRDGRQRLPSASPPF